MWRFGKAQKAYFSDDALDTESWFPDELIDKLFFIWDDDGEEGEQSEKKDESL